jgi:hypothetical protein
MADIDDAHRRLLTAFGVYQMNSNPAGIGNECTHWIYAALFEARALDSDRALGISQTGAHYTWGRLVDTDKVQRGDIAQFHHFKNTFFIYQNTSSGFTSLTSDQVRGPNHTGMVFTVPKNGTYYQMESHLHHPGIARMTVRGNTIYYDSFAIALSAADLAQIKGTSAWTAGVDTSDIEDMLERIDWVGMRDQHSIDLKAADQFVKKLKHKLSATITQPNGDDIACLLVVHADGYLRFSSPQASPARLAMDPAQLADEKAHLIHTLIRSGRHGGAATEDQYGGDNKKQRLYDHRFDWSFPQP